MDWVFGRIVAQRGKDGLVPLRQSVDPPYKRDTPFKQPPFPSPVAPVQLVLISFKPVLIALCCAGELC